MNIAAPFRTKLKASIQGIAYLMTRPLYFASVIAVGFIMTGVIIWSLNLNLAWFILADAPLSFLEKVDFFWDAQIGFYRAYSSIEALGTIIFSALFGVNSALILFVVRNRSHNKQKLPSKSSSAGTFFALLSTGCVACGTSILTPLLATLGATSASFTRELSSYFNWIGICFVLYSLYSLGLVTQSLHRQKQLEKK